MQQHSQSAFSLVELSIVLVILGLLTGGILGGQALIRAAELRSVGTEFERYSTARATFRDKYFALPGDMTNATSFWGAADGGDGLGNDCHAAIGTGTATCNGDGNGMLVGYVTTMSAETFRYWQQLASAGLIEGQYTGVPSSPVVPGSRFSSRGQNIPASKLAQAAWYTEGVGYISAASTWAWEGDYGNPFYIGIVEPGDIPELPALTTAEAWNLDTKMDDGKPSLGRVRAYKNKISCNSAASVASAAYLLDTSGIQCHLLLIPGS